MKLDDFRVGVVPGNGIVARFSDALVVVALDGPVDQDAVDRLLDACRVGSLGPRLADLRSVSATGVPSFAVVAEVDGGLAVHVEGDAQAAISGAAPTLHLSGRAPGWSNVFRQPFTSLALGAGADDETVDVDARLDFKAGVVTGSGAVLVPVTASSARTDGAAPVTRAAVAAPAPVDAAPVDAAPVAAAPVAAAPMPAPVTPAAAPMPAPAVAAPMPAPAVAAPMPAPVTPAAAPMPAPVAASPVPTAEPMGAPAPTASPPPAAPMADAAAAPSTPPATPADPQPAEVWGVRCKKGHFNDPDARYCAVCGIHMVQDKAVRVRGPRPVLGYLVFDDGKTYKLDTDYVIGRSPHGHEAVVGGQARPLVFGAGEDVISDVHARIVLRDWDVLVADCHSLYGTYVWAPGTAAWERLADDEPVALKAGSQVMLAQRGFMFQPVNKR
ncbi:MAG TPA: FHA domain-containing protein [Acidimicrobiales bacterium]|nr:FHA domain-containing protein [Acidimicrobiales bacterium]